MSSLRSEYEEIIRLQPTSPFLRNLSPFELKRLAERSSLKAFPAHTVLYRQGEPPSIFLLIVDGIIKLSEVSNNGHLMTLTMISHGQIVGGQSVAGSPTNLFSAETAKPTRALVWSGLEVRELMESMPALALNAYLVTFTRLEEFAVRWRELITDNVDQRIARALLRLARQLGKQTGHTLVIEDWISGQDLAGYAGTSLFTVSRVLNRWERSGRLYRRRNILVLEDIDGLVAIADGRSVEQVPPRAVSNG